MGLESQGTAATELGSPAMADALSGAERSEEEREREWESSSAGRSGAPLCRVSHGAHGREQGRAHAWLPCSRTRVAHRGNSANRWRAPEWGRWDAVLGRLGSELVHGPKMKFGLHLMVSNFA